MMKSFKNSKVFAFSTFKSVFRCKWCAPHEM